MTSPKPPEPATWLVRQEQYELWVCDDLNHPVGIVVKSNDLGVVAREKAAQETLHPSLKYRLFLRELREMVTHAQT